MGFADALQFTVGLDTSKVEAGLRAINKKGGAAATALTKGFAAAGVAAAAVGGFLAKGMIAASAEMEAATAQMATLLGSEEAALERMKELEAINLSTPYDLADLVKVDTTLQAMTQDAEKWRQGTLDLAAAMGIDVVEAAQAVGRAVSGGAGAADVLRERGILAMVEIQTGMKTAEMSADEFKEALLDTLSGPGIAGATARLASTFDGLMSNMRDQWQGFLREIGDEGAFDAVKEAAGQLLDILENQEVAVGNVARKISDAMVLGMVSALQFTGALHIAWLDFNLAINATEGLIGVAQVKINDMLHGMISGIRDFMDAMGDPLGVVDALDKSLANLEYNTGEWKSRVEEVTAEQKRLKEEAEATAEAYARAAYEIQRAADADGKGYDDGDDGGTGEDDPEVEAEGDKQDALTKLDANGNTQRLAQNKAHVRDMEGLYSTFADTLTSNYSGMAAAIIGEQQSLETAMRSATLGMFSDMLTILSKYMATKAAVAFAAGNFVAAGMFTAASGIAAAGAGAIAAKSGNMAAADASGGEVFHAGGMAPTVLREEVAVFNRRAADEQGLDEISTRHANEGMGGNSGEIVLVLGRDEFRFANNLNQSSRQGNGSATREARSQRQSTQRAGWAG